MRGLLINWRFNSLEKGITKSVKCPHCGKLLRKGHKLCVNCRQDPRKALVTDQTGGHKITCPKCKNLNEPSSVTCSSCGINFIQYEMSKSHDFSGMRGARKRRWKE